MNRRGVLALATLTIALQTTPTMAQQPSDIEAVKAASQAFYETLQILDDGSAMEKVRARVPYVTYLGPQGKSVIVGWDAQKKYWESFNKLFKQRSVALVDVHMHANGNLAWEIGRETGQAQMQDGTTKNVDWFATNVYEKLDGRWLLVSHHVQPKPQ